MLFEWLLVTRLNAQGPAVCLGREAGAVPVHGPGGRFLHRPQQWLLFAKHLRVLAHLNSVRRVLVLGLLADKETVKKRSVIKWRSQDSNSRSGSKPAPFNRLLHKLRLTCSWDKPFETDNPRESSCSHGGVGEVSLENCHYSRSWPPQRVAALGARGRRFRRTDGDDVQGSRGPSKSLAPGQECREGRGSVWAAEWEQRGESGEAAAWGPPACRPSLENGLVGPVESFRLFPRNSGKSLKGFKQH